MLTISSHLAQFDLIEAHIAFNQERRHIVTVAYRTDFPNKRWAAKRINAEGQFQSQILPDELDENLFIRVIAAGVKLTKAEATQIFSPVYFSPDKYEE